MLQKFKTKCKNTSLHYTFYDRTIDIPVHHWDSIHNNNLFFSLAYLKTLEKTLSATIKFKYILFYDGSTPVAIATTQLIKFTPTELNFQEFPCMVTDALRNTILKNKEIKTLICGNLFSCGEHGFIHTDDISPKQAFESLSDALRSIRKTETEDKASFILVKEFWPSSYTNSDYIKKQDFREFRIDVNMILKLDPLWDSFDTYLTSMKTKFRSRTKKVFEKSASLHIKDFTAVEIETYRDAINTLYLSVIDKADFKIGKLNATTFRDLKINLKETFIFKAYLLDDKLIGFTTAFVSGEAIEANHIGIDYDYNKIHAVYQRMLYDYVTIAITHKASELRLGRTAEIIKSCVGAKPVQMKLYIRHRNAISNTILKPIVDFITPNEYEIRNPFKLQLD